MKPQGLIEAACIVCAAMLLWAGNALPAIALLLFAIYIQGEK